MNKADVLFSSGYLETPTITQPLTEACVFCLHTRKLSAIITSR